MQCEREATSRQGDKPAAWQLLETLRDRLPHLWKASTIKLGTNGMMLAARYTSRRAVVCFEGLSTTAGISCIGVDEFKTAFHHSLNEVNDNSV